MSTTATKPWTRAEEIHFYLVLQQLLTRSRQAMERFCATLPPGTFAITVNGQLWPGLEQDRWVRAIEMEFFPLNAETAAWILKHTAQLNPLHWRFLDFLNYHHGWVRAHALWQQGSNRGYQFHAGRNFPSLLDAWVQRTIDGLHEGAPKPPHLYMKDFAGRWYTASTYLPNPNKEGV